MVTAICPEVSITLVQKFNDIPFYSIIATLNHIVREILLPLDVRAQKETMDLICFISNAFVDLLSDVSNNVCYEQNKKNIMPEHTIRAL